MKTPLIYTPQASIAPEHLDQHRRWYTTTHAPRLMGLGFYSCRMFDGEGTRWCNLYEIPGTEIFETPGYKHIGDSDVFMKLNISRFIDLNVTTYAQDRVLGSDGAVLPHVPTMGAPVLSYIRFDWSGKDGELQQWLREAVWTGCSKAAPVRTIRLLHRHSEHPQLKTNYPHWAAAIEWAHAHPQTPAQTDAAPRAALEVALERGAKALGSAASRVSHETFRRRFGLVREDCFPD